MRSTETADQITFPSQGKLIKVKLTELSLVIVDSYHDNGRKTEVGDYRWEEMVALARRKVK